VYTILHPSPKGRTANTQIVSDTRKLLTQCSIAHVKKSREGFDLEKR